MKQDKKRSSGRNAQNKGAQNERRKKVIKRLEEQLKSGVKTEKGTHVLTAATTGNNVPLTEKDVERIKKEISILNSRITN
jgi:hypothetical protein